MEIAYFIFKQVSSDKWKAPKTRHLSVQVRIEKELGKSLLAYAFTVQYIAAEERRIKLEPENSTAILGCIIALMNSLFYTKLFNDITVQNVSDEVKARYTFKIALTSLST